MLKKILVVLALTGLAAACAPTPTPYPTPDMAATEREIARRVEATLTAVAPTPTAAALTPTITPSATPSARLLLPSTQVAAPGPTVTPSPTPKCEDAYEPDNSITEAKTITGPEERRFFKSSGKEDKYPWGPENIDQDWVKFEAKADWVYQIRAARIGHFSSCDPYLRLYDSEGNLLAENDNYWGKDAEIWWWNQGPGQILYVQATEANDKADCNLFYELSVTPWSPDEFKSRFKK